MADDDPVIISGLLMALARLPKQEARARTIESDEPQVLIADGNDVVYEAPDPVRQAVMALSVEASSSLKPISGASAAAGHAGISASAAAQKGLRPVQWRYLMALGR
ncbi:hypothetical protein [Acidovorax sp. MR-S7]|uniref:hypothetical protein n=1 Tax=Acidovorax sp. MR-S7 TaxID=1268622 RepID=UPI00035C961D|nr:hypothetical protein [Acidovorax sp. MR-S7]GAD21928.1 cyclopropane fatty acid synthase and related methyltransferases [Acidovorax sp. MR-S7]